MSGLVLPTLNVVLAGPDTQAVTMLWNKLHSNDKLDKSSSPYMSKLNFVWDEHYLIWHTGLDNLNELTANSTAQRTAVTATQLPIITIIFYNLGVKGSLLAARDQVETARQYSASTKILLVGREAENGKELEAESTYTMFKDASGFSEQNIRITDSGSVTGTIGNLLTLITDGKDHSVGNAEADLAFLLN